MPLLNICAISGNNRVVQVGLAFLSTEKKGDYTWAIQQLRQVMTSNSIEEPISIVTDRELALINCIEALFPESLHLLCRWHVNMNVLAKTKRFFPAPIKSPTGKVDRHPSFKAFLDDWNTLLSSSTEESYNEQLEKMQRAHPAGAMSYCSSTWLLWKEKLVAYWINQNYHFGVTVTSPIEGCHATLKSYLQRGNGDLRTVYERLQHFWDGQHSSFKSTLAQQKLRLKHQLNIPLFAAVLQQVHSFALQKILQEQAKLPANNRPPPQECTCSIQYSHGLPCYHTIWARKQDGGVIRLEDIHRHWYYFRPDINATVPTAPAPCPVLQPVAIRGKGRPRGALGGVVRIAESSTRRQPSAWELPSSSAPAILNRTESSTGQLFIVNSGLKRTSTTALAMARLGAGHIDQYEPGTQRERAYMCGISSIYKEDSIEDAATIAVRAMNGNTAGAGRIDCIDGIEVFTQDAEFDMLDDDFCE